MYSNEPEVSKCFCGNDALASHSNTYCSRSCALADAEFALGGAASHYRTAQSAKAFDRQARRRHPRKLDLKEDLHIDTDIPITISSPRQNTPPMYYGPDALSSASTLASTLSSSDSPSSSPSSRFPAIRKLFKLRLNVDR